MRDPKALVQALIHPVTTRNNTPEGEDVITSVNLEFVNVTEHFLLETEGSDVLRAINHLCLTPEAIESNSSGDR